MLDVNLQPFPVLSTPRLTLRAVNFGDAEAIFAMRTDAEVLKYIDIERPKSVEAVFDWIKMIHGIHEKNDGVLWGITLKGSEEMLGSIGLWNIEKLHHRAEIGYMLSPAWQGKGIMQEALKEAVKYAFDVICLHSIAASVNPANQASINLLERNGFVREAYFRENYYYKDKIVDSAVYSLITTKK
ncbi:GNAT family protein [Mucilaginibacter sp.]|uniref:GNAT family N-acetyltransferase n=1 Tax=Mucilaginibacter sp. TaxID=1882438 RepID=UPI0032652E15